MNMNQSLELRRYGVKQFVARIKSPKTGQRFNVFNSGDPKYYLFDPIDKHDCSLCCAFPVRKTELKAEYKRALAHGWGNTG